MKLVHLALAWVSVGAAVFILAGAVLAALRGREPPLLRPLERAFAGLIGLQLIVGLLDLATGHRPHDPLHFLYAGLALLTLPVARAFGRRRGQVAFYRLIGAVLLLGILFRLFTT